MSAITFHKDMPVCIRYMVITVQIGRFTGWVDIDAWRTSALLHERHVACIDASISVQIAVSGLALVRDAIEISIFTLSVSDVTGIHDTVPVAVRLAFIRHAVSVAVHDGTFESLTGIGQAVLVAIDKVR